MPLLQNVSTVHVLYIKQNITSHSALVWNSYAYIVLCMFLDTIRYLSLHDNKYIRYFSGHTKKLVSLNSTTICTSATIQCCTCNISNFRVVTLNMSPIDDTFLSGSMDKTIRLWDLRSPNCQVLHWTCTNCQSWGSLYRTSVFRGSCIFLGDQWPPSIPKV